MPFAAITCGVPTSKSAVYLKRQDFTRRCSRRRRPGGISTSIFPEIDFEFLELFLLGRTVNCFDGAADICKVDESTRLFSQSVDKLNIPIFAEILLQLLLRKRFEIDISDVNVSARSGVHRNRNTGWERPRMLTPTNFQPTVVNHQSLQGRHLVESDSGV